MRTYIRLSPFPRCKYCGGQMDYYIPGLADEDHSHPECAGKAIAEAALATFRKELKKSSRVAGTNPDPTSSSCMDGHKHASKHTEK